MLQVDYGLINQYYRFSFGAWHKFVKPLGVGVAFFLAVGVVIGIFSDNIRAFGFSLSTLLGPVQYSVW